MKKKIISLIAAISLSISFIGCSATTTSNSSSDSIEYEYEIHEHDHSEHEESASDEVVDFNTLEDRIVIDNEYATLTLTDTYTSVYGFESDFVLTNNTEDIDIDFYITDVKFNGVYVADPAYTFSAASVAPGTTINTEETDENDAEFNYILYVSGVNFYGAELMGDITDIEMTLNITKSDDSATFKSSNLLASETVHYYNAGEENAITATKDSLNILEEVVDNETCSISILGIDDFSMLVFYIENYTDAPITIQGNGNVSINGLSDPLGYMDTFLIPAQTNGIATCFLWTTMFEDYGIEEIESIEVPLLIQGGTFNEATETYTYEDLFTTTATFNP